MKLIPILSAIALSTSAASAATLTFDGDICNGGNSCSNGQTLDQSYGDIAGQVDIVYDADRGTVAKEDILFWSTGYETLQNVGYSLSSGVGMAIDFVAAAGYSVTLGGFDIAPYVNRVRNTRLVIKEIGGGTLYDSGVFQVSTDGVTNYGVPYTSNTGLRLEFGPDSWDVGIDNIVYSTAKINQPPAVPLPAAGWMLLAGLGGLCAARKRRT